MATIPFESLEPILDTLLQEGMLLYPYRKEALKNQYPWTFGVLFPPSYCAANPEERSHSVVESLLAAAPEASLEIRVRFRTLENSEPVVRQLSSGPLGIPSSEVSGVKTGHCGEIEWRLGWQLCPVETGLLKIRATVQNNTRVSMAQTSRNDALNRALLSTHFVLGTDRGAFLSSFDPPKAVEKHASRLRSEGVWPVLMGTPNCPEFVLGSPIILYDFPAVAPQSSIPFCDATEIDEMLALRVMTLSDEERAAIEAEGGAGAGILRAVNSLRPEQLKNLHGRWGAGIEPGAKVRLRPGRDADAFDTLLRGKAATILSIEQDLEGNCLVTVTVDEDPGKDLGLEGKPGHRFFFRPEELEPL